MTMREATAEEKAHWDDLIWDSPAGADLMQLEPYAARVKAQTWDYRQMIHSHPGYPDVPVIYLTRRVLPFGDYWYAPMGPRVTDPTHFQLICDDLRATKAFQVILEPTIAVTGPQDREALIGSTPGLGDFPTLQVGHSTVFIDLTPSEEEILASFRQRARRAIRKASDAVIEHRTDDEAIEIFWPLYAETIERAKLPLRRKDYYVNAWKTYIELGQGHFVLARPDEQSAHVAGAYLWQHRDLGYYRDGGSIRSPQASGLQYRVQWESMRWCKEQGATTYDLFAAPPSWQADDESHQLHGLVQFKTAFGEITDTVSTLRLVNDPRRVALWDKVGIRVHHRLNRRKNPLYY